MQTGTIRHWNDSKGYGFITADQGSNDIFMHISAWQGENRPQQGDKVQFTVTQTDKHPAAKEVLPIGGKARQPAYFQPLPTKKTSKKTSLGALVFAIAAMALYAFVQHSGLFGNHQPQHTQTASQTAAQNLPEPAHTIALIKAGGPFPYERDGIIFANREGLLPKKPRGYYHEYTVPTPGASDRGARRIITGGNPPEVYYYTQDHYRSFQKIEEQP